MILLGLFTIINKQLRKTQDTIALLIILFGGLLLIIFMGDFYQFALANNYTLWNLPFSKEEIYEKVL